MATYFSNNGGENWEGPFSQAELDSFRAAGVISDSTILREEDAAAQAAAPQAVPPAMPQMPAPAAQPVSDPNLSYMVGVDGQQKGPFTLEQLHDMLLRGEITKESLVWAQGMSQWMPFSQVAGGPSSGVVGGTLGSLTGLGGLRGFSLASFFSEIFKRHKPEEMVDFFCCGSSKTTPSLQEVNANWPSPWIFARLIVLCLVLFFGFNWASFEFKNSNLVPGLMFVGNFGIPFCVLILFMELNVRRDVPFYAVLKALVLGGLLSLIFSLFLFRWHGGESAVWAGPIEEPGKLLAVILIASNLRNGRVLTGVLLGAAIGAGFAAFESAGYTFTTLLQMIGGAVQGLSYRQMCDVGLDADRVMITRALLSPFAHVLWTAITAGAFWLVMGLRIKDGRRVPEDTSLGLDILLDFRFLRIALIPVGLHMLWNSQIMSDNYILKCLLCGLVGWVTVFLLVQAGLNQVREEKMKL